VAVRDNSPTSSSNRFARFLVVGVVAAGINILSRVAISYFTSFEVAVALAFPIALTFAFSMSRLFVFGASQRAVWDEYLRFFLVNLAALAQVWFLSIALARWIFPATSWTFHPELLAHAIGVCSPVVTSYYAHKLFTFRQGRPTER
jgi:putative flippase GtrA